MIKRFVDWLINQAKKSPYTHIEGTHDSDYMRRWWLIPYNRFGISCRIHEILQSDDDRAFHDHPWWYITIVLRGGYWEVRPKYDHSGIYQGPERKWVGPGSIRFRRAKSWHRLELENGAAAYTLFICGRKSQEWGGLPNPATKLHRRECFKPSAPPDFERFE